MKNLPDLTIAGRPTRDIRPLLQARTRSRETREFLPPSLVRPAHLFQGGGESASSSLTLATLRAIASGEPMGQSLAALISTDRLLVHGIPPVLK